MHSSPKISICIPVYKTEDVLARCLNSICIQDFAEKEVIIVNDASSGKDQHHRSAKKIVYSILKKNKIPFTYIEHNKNLGILETRRDAVQAASGEYIFTLDSDDFIEGTDALSVLYAAAIEHNADILNSTAKVYSDNPNSPIAKIRQQMLDSITTTELNGREILNDYIITKNHCGFLWGKLIRRAVFINALSNIPYTICTMAEDFIFYFFICLEAQKYFGIPQRFYRYSVDTGISSNSKISDINRWIRVCSAASVFTVISEFIKDHPEINLTQEQTEQIKKICNGFVANNLKQLKQQVVPELQQQAYDVLCEMWGEDYVKIVEKILSLAK